MRFVFPTFSLAINCSWFFKIILSLDITSCALPSFLFSVVPRSSLYGTNRLKDLLLAVTMQDELLMLFIFLHAGGAMEQLDPQSTTAPRASEGPANDVCLCVGLYVYGVGISRRRMREDERIHSFCATVQTHTHTQGHENNRNERTTRTCLEPH